MIGGGDDHIDKSFGTACTLLHHMNAYDINEVVFSHNTKNRPAVRDEKEIEGVKQIIQFLWSKADLADEGKGVDKLQ